VATLDRDHALAALGTLINGGQVYSAFLPSVFTIRHFGADPATVKDIRDGERIATGFVLVMGVAIAFLVESPVPLYSAILLAVVMVSVYEYALATKHGDGDTEAEEA